MSHGANANAKDRNGMGPLHCACWKGQTETVEFLLENGAQIAEVDGSMKSTLHWAVQYGHVQVLHVLLQRSGGALLGNADKSEQTVLHYAAFRGNPIILQMLLDAGARTDIKDQDERTALHLAAQCDHVECVELLVHTSSHEVNNGDMDGRTPLHLASIEGNHVVVQLLLQLGADPGKKDEDHCTALMLASSKGHVSVLRVLLENHANLNEVDKLKNSALHYACIGGHTPAVLTLLEKNADVSLANARDQIPIDLAIDKLHNDVAVAMLKHKSWRTCMSVYSEHGLTVLDRLIARLPEAAKVVLDHCIEKTGREEDDENCTTTYDYQYLDPGPDHPACQKKRYFALNTMVQHHRDSLLAHPLCQEILKYKWLRFGRVTLALNISVYMGYLLFLTLYVAEWMVIHRDRSNSTYGDCYATVFGGNGTVGMSPAMEEVYITDESFFIRNVGFLLNVFILLFLLRELFKIFQQRWKYLISLFNYIAWILIFCTLVFVWSVQQHSCLIVQQRSGWIALFLAWINFIMYLRRIDFLGIYVIMFVTVMGSMLKAVIVYFFFSWAFAGSFLVLLPDSKMFRTIGIALMQVFVMTLGEIEFVDNFVGDDLEPFEIDIHIILVIFVFIMPIVLMNLMIGLAVGDIDKIQRNAYLKRLSLQVELLYQLENLLPRFIQKTVYIRRVTFTSRRSDNQRCDKFWGAVWGEQTGSAFLTDEGQDGAKKSLAEILQEMHLTNRRLRQLQTQLRQQGRHIQKFSLSPQALLQSSSQHKLCSSRSVSNISEISVYDNL